jgi:5-hydroxyisourate hydrolase
MSRLSTHVLDVALGKPAAGVAVRLDVLPPANEGGGTLILASAVTDDDGRVGDLLEGAALEAGIYRLTFQTGAYFTATGRTSFYPRVQVTFEVTAPAQHHHVPLLLSPFGYSTYRGS